MKWVEALKLWNAKHNPGKWCVAKKGTKEYEEVKAIMNAKPPTAEEFKKRREEAKGKSLPFVVARKIEKMIEEGKSPNEISKYYNSVKPEIVKYGTGKSPKFIKEIEELMKKTREKHTKYMEDVSKSKEIKGRLLKATAKKRIAKAILKKVAEKRRLAKLPSDVKEKVAKFVGVGKASPKEIEEARKELEYIRAVIEKDDEVKQVNGKELLKFLVKQGVKDNTEWTVYFDEILVGSPYDEMYDNLYQGDEFVGILKEVVPELSKHIEIGYGYFSYEEGASRIFGENDVYRAVKDHMERLADMEGEELDKDAEIELGEDEVIHYADIDGFITSYFKESEFLKELPILTALVK